MSHTMQLRVYYEDTDCGNVVYYANYLRYMERSRTELMRSRGVHLGRLQENGVWFIVAEAHVRYIAPARYDDLLEICSKVGSLGGASIEIETAILRGGELLVSGTVKMACTDSSGRPMRIPAEVKERLKD
jgi:tol-pal system-associated acyl-CoA thioesterase